MQLHHVFFLSIVSLAVLMSAAFAAAGPALGGAASLGLGLGLAIGGAVPGAAFGAAALKARGMKILKAETNRHAAALLQRFTQLTAPNRYGYVDLTRWRAEVREFRRALPQRLPLVNDAAVYKVVTDRVMELAEGAGLRAGHESVLLDQRGLARFVVDELSKLKWRAKIVAANLGAEHHVLAERGDVRAVLLCRPRGRIDVGDVQAAMAARGRVHADLAAVVSQDGATQGARLLARQMRVGLLAGGQVAAINQAAAKVSHVRREGGGKVTPLRPKQAVQLSS